MYICKILHPLFNKVSKKIYIVQLSSRTSNTPNALVSSKQIRLKESALIIEFRMKSGREFQTVGPATKKTRWPQVLMCGTASI